MRFLPLLVSLSLPVLLAAQGATSSAPPATAARPLAPFAAERVAVTPVQFWRADSAGWSVAADGNGLRAGLDSAIAREFRDRGMAARWAFAADVVRSARRNPTLRADPTALGAGRWRSELPEAGDAVPGLVADNLRTITALGDTRYALIPVELRGHGADAVLRLVIVDTRRRSVVWAADLGASAQPDAVASLAARLADLVVDP